MEMQLIGLVVSLIGGILDPLTLGTAILIGTLSPSKYWAAGLGLLVGLGLAAMAASMSTTLNTHYSLVDGWLLQVSNSFILSGCVYFLKRGWQAFNRTQGEMDDCESYLQEMNNPALVGKSDKPCSSEPVRSKVKLNPEPLTTKRKAKPKPWRLNLVQKIIVSLMLPVLMVTGVKAITAGMMTFQSEYWWFWLGGLSVLLLVELWLWRGKASIDKNIN